MDSERLFLTSSLGMYLANVSVRCSSPLQGDEVEVVGPQFYSYAIACSERYFKIYDKAA